ncbi:MAG TPA: hypothetical protein VF834_05035 [Streptosporangiaceae bacterium]
MTTVAIRHQVQDYDTWRGIFDEHAATRRQHGLTSDAVLRGAEDPNDILVLMHWPAVSNAQAFMADASFKEAMSRAGVVSAPRIEFYEEAGS